MGVDASDAEVLELYRRIIELLKMFIAFTSWLVLNFRVFGRITDITYTIVHLLLLICQAGSSLIFCGG